MREVYAWTSANNTGGRWMIIRNGTVDLKRTNYAGAAGGKLFMEFVWFVASNPRARVGVFDILRGSPYNPVFPDLLGRAGYAN